LLVILPLWQGRAVFTKIRQGGRELWISGVCWGVMFTAFMVALTLTSVANVLVTMSAGPLLTALAARIFIGHKLPSRTWAAIVRGPRHRLDVRHQARRRPTAWHAGGLWRAAGRRCCNWTVVQHAHCQGARHRPGASRC
jgi:hypothetical protein